MQPAVADDRHQNPSSSTLKWILGLGTAALAVGGTVLAVRSAAASAARRTAARIPSVVPEEPDYVLPDLTDSMQAATDWMEREYPGLKICHRQGALRGPAKEPHVGFHHLYKIYEYTGGPPGSPRWVAAHAWETPQGSGHGAPGSDDIDRLQREIIETSNEGRRAWDELSADVRGTWAQLSGGC